ncbi:MAG TPA: hypothetical protein LFW14_04520 [Rickettsia endosymbiont of Degeeriella rufa]|nr:hypothetical protein [Rickettsia endosymbiont of Columbicola hoogstraali]HJD62811.1 hypothetical protein [Rickettsia endosymbiont of Degeeriella rufa]
MSNQNKKSNYEIVLAFVEKEVNKLKDEIAHLLENPTKEENIEKIEQRLEELERIFYETC